MIYSIINQKGGVGKTTTTLNLGYELMKKGKKVLLVDLDPQANLTTCLTYGKKVKEEYTIDKLFYKEMEEQTYNLNDFIQSRNGLDYLASSIELSGIEIMLISAMSREYILKNILDAIKEQYDYILIDCMPSLGMFVINALNASDEVIIISSAQLLSAKGIELLLKSIVKVKKNLNRALAIKGLLITMHSPHLKEHKKMCSVIKETYADYIKIFDTKIPRSIRVDEAIAKGLPLKELDKKHPAAVAYHEFAAEIIGEKGN